MKLDFASYNHSGLIVQVATCPREEVKQPILRDSYPDTITKLANNFSAGHATT